MTAEEAIALVTEFQANRWKTTSPNIEGWNATPYEDAWLLSPSGDRMTSLMWLVRNGQVRSVHLAFDSVGEALAEMKDGPLSVEEAYNLLTMLRIHNRSQGHQSIDDWDAEAHEDAWIFRPHPGGEEDNVYVVRNCRARKVLAPTESLLEVLEDMKSRPV
jgi:hypothetical protein